MQDETGLAHAEMEVGRPGDVDIVEQPASASRWPAAPTYRWAVAPRKVHSAGMCDSRVSGNFFRHARWCSDSSAVLTTAEDRTLRVYDCKTDDEILIPDTGRSFAQPDAIHAVQWYPSASATSPETFCFMASVKDTSVRLIDASDGRIRASYPIIDHRERYIAPHCLAFNPASSRVYCGHENAIEVLEIASPGHDTSERLKTTFSRKESSGQKGIISSIAFCTDYAGSYAAGSYTGSVAIYSEDTGSTPLMHLEEVCPNGVTHLAYNPISPLSLFVGSRRNSAIQEYDLRSPSKPVSEFARQGSSNQRLWFDVDPWGRYLCAGDTEGYVSVWDLSDPTRSEPLFKQRLYQDAVGSVQLHPYKPLLLSVSGSRSFRDTLGYESDDSESATSSASEDEEEATGPGISKSRTLTTSASPAPALDIWSFA